MHRQTKIFVVVGHQKVTDNSRDLCKRRFNRIQHLTSIRSVTKVKEEMTEMLYQRTLNTKCFSLDIFHTCYVKNLLCSNVVALSSAEAFPSSVVFALTLM